MVATVFFTYLLIWPAISFLMRNQEPAARGGCLNLTVGVFAVVEVFFAWKEGSYQKDSHSAAALVFEVIG